jgi:septum formation protein
MKQERQLILASRSPRRKQLLKEAALKFKVKPARVSEEMGRRFSVARLKAVALRKAKAAAKRLKKGVVIGADTIVVVKGKIYGKPGSIRKARKMLAELSGTVQNVWSAVALVDTENGKSSVKTCRSRIKMKKLSPEDIEYLANKNLDKAGGYGIQEDDEYLTVLGGSLTNIVGFPMGLVKRMLKEFKVFFVL